MKKDKYNTHGPQDKDSRCGFMRDKANGKKRHEPFERLSELSLLERCLDEKSQNPNWSLTPRFGLVYPNKYLVDQTFFL